MEDGLKINTNKLLLCLIGLMLFFNIVFQTTLLKYKYSGISTFDFRVEIALRIAIVLVGLYQTRYYTKQEVQELMLFLLISGVSLYTLKYFAVFDLFFIAFFCRKIEPSKIIDTFFYSILAGFLTVLMLNHLGFMPEFNIYRSLTNQVRLNLGFTHPNVLGRIVFLLCALYTLKKQNEIRAYHLLLMGIIAYWVYVYPNSVTSALMILLIVVLLSITKIYSFLFQKELIKNTIFRIAVLVLVPIILIVVYVILLNQSGENVFSDLSRTFSLRFIYGMQAISNYGIHLFGSNLPIVSNAGAYFGDSSMKYFVIDCLYIYLPVQYGVVPTILYFGEYIKSVRNCVRQKDIYMTVLLAIMAVYSISENGAALFYSSFIFIYSLSRKYTSKKSDEERIGE